MADKIIVGIDLGTTYSVVSYFDEKTGQPIPIENLDGSYTTPSVVGISDAGEVIVGKSAKNQLVADPERTVAEVKRHMGEMEGTLQDASSSAQGTGVPFKIRMAGKEYLPQEISAYILKFIKNYAEGKLGKEITDAVITCPAYFTEVQRTATIQAGEIAGFNVRRIINEPTAAAISFGMVEDASSFQEADIYDETGSGRGQARKIVVYDLGGGTFDVSVIELFAGNVKVLATDGNSRLGGVDFDNRIVDWAIREIEREHGVDLRDNPYALQNIKNKAEESKISLSSQDSVSMILPNIAVQRSGKPVNAKLQLSRVDFEAMIKDRIDETMECVRRALESKNLGVSEIHDVLLVGGSSRIPMVRRQIENFFGRQPRADIHPDLCVSLGAALVAYGYARADSGEAADVVGGISLPGGGGICDVTGHSLGVRELDNNFSKLIEKDTPIPCSAKNTYTTVVDNQTVVNVDVFQGESKYIDEPGMTCLGGRSLRGIPPARRGIPQIEVSFYLDVNGKLEVTAVETKSNQKITAEFQYKGVSQMKDHELLQARLEVAKMASPLESQSGIPAEFQAYWDKAQNLAKSASGERKARLEKAMRDFQDAIAQGGESEIRRSGNDLSDAVFDCMD